MLTLKNVKKTYREFQLDCSLEILPGQIIGLVGRNGAGKSTTFKAALGLISYESGEIQLFGKPIEKLKDHDRQKLGISLAESGFSEFLMIKDIIPMLNTFYTHFQKEFFVDKCTAFQLPFDKPIKEFSTGMKARLKVLVAISHHASLLILDEPTAGLDVVARDEILNLLQDYLEKDETRSILISSHISKDLEQLCDTLYFIDQGKIILKEDTDVLLDQYGVVKVTAEQFLWMEKEYIIALISTSFGYQCLTDQREFYRENHPDYVVEKANIDEIVRMVMGGEKHEGFVY
ncbi:ABC transporter [Enterococcus florum]|uniref:ABC transporter n=1 Tax=Enterococcus florum TaxID=2480627 RepID=A0A4P5PIF7_9ENTE|nr:ABC transporter ATP-binding protein [Enterococcus florum]GCF93143.1 ABC transporter [Enterococcus florum]